MDDSGNQLYRGMQETTARLISGGPFIDHQQQIAPPDARASRMAFSIIPAFSLLIGYSPLGRYAMRQNAWHSGNWVGSNQTIIPMNRKSKPGGGAPYRGSAG